MELKDALKNIAERAKTSPSTIQSEEATKQSLILPFIAALGYDIFNPQEVMPEYIADIGIKKGEKVDYAILHEGQPIIFIECKACNAELSREHASQLLRYFGTSTDTRFGILTNGLVYEFYTDLVNKNQMDERPFFTFNILKHNNKDLSILLKFAKTDLDPEKIIKDAERLKYLGEIKNLLGVLLNIPDEDFVKYFAKHVYGGSFTAKFKTEFTPIVKEALTQFIDDKVDEQIIKAREDIKKNQEVQPPAPPKTAESETPLPEEIEGFNIIRAICCRYVPAEQVFIYYNKGYCSLYCSAYPDGSRKEQICRFYFKAPNKYLGLFDKEKEERVKIKDTVEIYGFANRIAAVVEATLNKANSKQSKSNSPEEPTA